jgi:hypothetical protein
MRKLIPVSALLMLFAVGGCAPTDVVNSMQIYDPVDAVQPYTQRADKVTLSAGNAQEVNTRIHEVDPWPRNVGNTRIALSGEKMADAVYRYRCGRAPQPALVPVGTSSAGITGGGGASGVAVTRPGSECAGGAPAQVK